LSNLKLCSGLGNGERQGLTTTAPLASKARDEETIVSTAFTP